MLELIIYDKRNNKTFKLVFNDYSSDKQKVRKLLSRMLYSDKICLVDCYCDGSWINDNRIQWLLDNAMTIIRKD